MDNWKSVQQTKQLLQLSRAISASFGYTLNMSNSDQPSSEIDRLLAVMDRLRDPDNGCPWDLAQTFATIVPHTIEECYEVAETIETQDWKALKDELGDLLFQVVFYAKLGSEKDLFTFTDIAGAITEKMIRRHPNVFADQRLDSAEAQSAVWEAQKEMEKPRLSALDNIAVTLPALTRALKLQKRASAKGFDWPEALPVLEKMKEEIGELEVEMASDNQAAIMDEVGDLLFTCVNLARKLSVDPEAALRGSCRKFERRYRAVEASGAASPEEMETAWETAKKAER